jgi:hypothetical protein
MMKHRKAKVRTGVALFAAAALPLGILAVGNGGEKNPKAVAAKAAADARHADKVKNPKAVEAKNQVKGKNPTCVLVVPKNPASVAGLAGVYQLGDGNTVCSVADPATAVRVTATITAPDGTVTTFLPTVVDNDTDPLPVVTPPVVADGSTVAVSVEFAGERLKPVGPGHKTPITISNLTPPA